MRHPHDLLVAKNRPVSSCSPAASDLSEGFSGACPEEESNVLPKPTLDCP